MMNSTSFISALLLVAGLASLLQQVRSAPLGSDSEQSGALLELLASRQLESGQQRKARSLRQEQLEEVQALRSQLPELIAQARDSDRFAERALVNALIQASQAAVAKMLQQREQQAAVGAQQRAPQSSNSFAHAGQLATWLPMSEGAVLEGGDLFGEGRGLDSFGALEAALASNELRPAAESASPSLRHQQQQQQQQQQYAGSSVDKREYSKPCSFNMVSCAKNPFRKLKAENY